MITRRVFQCCHPPWISQVIDQPRQRSSNNAIHTAMQVASNRKRSAFSYRHLLADRIPLDQTT
jgi:hypothetical protein